MKRTLSLLLTLILSLSLAACNSTESTKEQTPPPPPQETTSSQPDKVVQGIINRIDSYLVLLIGDGEYQIMDYGDKVTMDGFEEGDKVEVTYTGELGVEGSTPVITGISKTE